MSKYPRVCEKRNQPRVNKPNPGCATLTTTGVQQHEARAPAQPCRAFLLPGNTCGAEESESPDRDRSAGPVALSPALLFDCAEEDRVPTAPGKPGIIGPDLENLGKQGVWGQKPGKILQNLEKNLTSP